MAPARGRADADVAAAQTAAGQAAQSDTATGAQQARSSVYEGSIKQATDVNAEELTALLGVARGQLSQNAQQKLDDIFLAHMQTTLADEREHKANLRAVQLDRLASLNTTSKLGNDRMWNVNETDAYASILATKVAERLGDD